MAHSSQVKLQARVQPSETFSEFLGEDPILWDVKLTTKGGHVVFAHSAILAARSLYFRSLLRGDQVVHELPEIPVSAKSVGSVLRYMYTDTINFDTDEVESLRELFFVARKWKLFILEALFGKIMGAEVTIPTRLPSVWDDFGAMLLGEGNDSADAILQVGARDFRVHRIVLVAASDFFRSLFTMGWKESFVVDDHEQKKKELRVVPIGNISSEDFAAVLHFAYTHRLPRSHENRLEDLLRLQPASGYFAFPALAEGIAARIATVVELNYNNCASIYNMAKASSFATLEGKCCEFVLQRFESFPLTRFLSLPRDLLVRVLERGEIDAEEEVVFERLIRWGFAQLGRAQLPDTSRIRIAHDAELQCTLDGMLPPTVLMTKRNKRALLGYNPFSMQELLV